MYVDNILTADGCHDQLISLILMDERSTMAELGFSKKVASGMFIFYPNTRFAVKIPQVRSHSHPTPTNDLFTASSLFARCRFRIFPSLFPSRAAKASMISSCSLTAAAQRSGDMLAR